MAEELFLAARDLIYFRHDGDHLGRALQGVVRPRIAPPIPAAGGICRNDRGNGLRIQNHDIVAIGPLVDARPLNERESYGLLVSRAAMQSNYQAASLSLRAALRDKDPGRAVHVNG